MTLEAKQLELAKYCAQGNYKAVVKFLQTKSNRRFVLDYRTSGIVEYSFEKIFLGDYSPLIAAAINGHIEICKYLLESHEPRADINYTGGRKKDYSPLDCAIHWCEKNKRKLVFYLLDQGAMTYEMISERNKGTALENADDHQAEITRRVKENEKAIGYTAAGAGAGIVIAASCTLVGTFFFPGPGSALGLAAGGALGAGVTGLANRIGAGKDILRDTIEASLLREWCESKNRQPRPAPPPSIPLPDRQKAFCRKLKKYLSHHIRFFDEMSLTVAFKAANSLQDSLMNWVKSTADEQAKRVFDNLGRELLIINITLKDIILLQNAFLRVEDRDLNSYIDSVFTTYSDNICKIEESNLNDLCKGVAVRILIYIKQQKEAGVNQSMKDLFLSGVMHGRSDIYDIKEFKCNNSEENITLGQLFNEPERINRPWYGQI